MRYFMTGLAALALGATATAAAAENLVVRYDDLDLATTKGQKALNQRIDRAARDVCGAGEIVTGTRVDRTSACVASARNAARVQMAALVEHAQRGG